MRSRSAAFIALIVALAVATARSEVTEGEWPRLIVVEEVKYGEDVGEITLYKFNPNNASKVQLSMPLTLYRGLAANAYSDKVCHFHLQTYGIICHQKEDQIDVDFLPDIPRSNYEKLKELKNNVMSLSPSGDHLIWQEVNLGGVWIMNLKTQKSRLLIELEKSNGNRYPFIQVDWDNGYLLALPLTGVHGIEVWELLGDSGAKRLKDIPTKGEISGLTLDPSTMTVYWVTRTNIRKASYTVRASRNEHKVYDYDFSALKVDTFRYYKNCLFWTETDQEGTKQHIYRHDLETENDDYRGFPVSEGGYIHSMVVFEDVTEAAKETDQCSKCSHICIPHRGLGYKCACPFGLPLANATECTRPLNVWVIAEETPKTMASKRYFQTYDAMTSEQEPKPTVSTKVSRTSKIVPQPEGYCYTLDGSLKCFNGTGFVLDTSQLQPRTSRVLEVSKDGGLFWFDGTCVRHRPHRSMSNVTWTLYCDPLIDSNNIVLDNVNWHLFYRNTVTSNVIHVDLASRSETVIVNGLNFTTTDDQPMRLAVDVSNQILYYLSKDYLFEARYDPELPEQTRSDHTIIFDLDIRNFKPHHLRYIEGVLYWAEVRNLPASSETDFVVKFDIGIETQETLARAASNFSIKSFDVQVPRTTEGEITCANRSHGCSHFCRGDIGSYSCWCPEELPVLKDNNCTGMELIAAIVEVDRTYNSKSTKIETFPASNLTTKIPTLLGQNTLWSGFSYTGEVGRLCWIQDSELLCKTAENSTELPVPGAQNVTMLVPKACNKDEVYWLSKRAKGDLCLFMWSPNFQTAIDLKLCLNGRPSSVTIDTFRKTLFWCGVYGGKSQLHWQTINTTMSTEAPNVIQAPEVCQGLAINEYQSKLFISVGDEIREYLYADFVVDPEPKDSSPAGTTVHEVTHTIQMDPGTLRYHDGYLLWTSRAQNGSGQFVNLLHRFDSEYTSKPFTVFEAHRQDRILQVEMLNSHKEPMTMSDPCRDHSCPFICYPANPFPETPRAHQCYCPPGHICEMDPAASMTLRDFVLWFVGLLAVILILNVVGFTVYKKRNEVQTNYAIRKFKYGDPERAEGAPDAAARAEHLPFSNLLDPDSLKIHKNKRLGEGNFGEVVEGQYEGRRVAIKTLKDDLDFTTLQAFFKELKIMSYVGKHENIVELIGADISGIYGGKVRAILEYCANGSLDEYLKKHRNVVPQGPNLYQNNPASNCVESAAYMFGVSEVQTNDTAETSFSLANSTPEDHTKTLFSNPKTIVPLLSHWSYQISRAMAFLTSKRIVHGDLASRNVLVCEDNILKVSDFGLSKNVYQKSVYESRNRNQKLPWKWAAPEVLEDRQFSFMSDVWSYGVTLWEVFTFAKTPYPNRVNWDDDFIRELKDGSLRVAKPELMPLEVYNSVVLRCFETKPEDRIDFASIEVFWVKYFNPEYEPENFVNVPL